MNKFLVGAFLFLLGAVSTHAEAKKKPIPSFDPNNIFDVSYGSFVSRATQTVDPIAGVGGDADPNKLAFAFEYVLDKEHIRRSQSSVPAFSSFTIKKAGHYSIFYAVTGHATLTGSPATRLTGPWTVALLHNGVLVEGSAIGISRANSLPGDEFTVSGEVIMQFAANDTLRLINSSPPPISITILQLEISPNTLNSAAIISMVQLDAEEP